MSGGRRYTRPTDMPQGGAMNRITIALASALLTSAAHAGPGFWSSTGPHGGVAYTVAADPTDPSQLYALTRGGVFRSVDGGDNWIEASDGFGVAPMVPFPIIVDAERSQDVYVFDAYERLYRSNDRGVSWTTTGFETEMWVRPRGLVDVPGTQGELWLLVTDSRDDGSEQPPLLRSIDAGATFVNFTTGLPAGRSARAVVFDPINPDHVLAVLDAARQTEVAAGDPFPAAMYRSVDGGATWSQVHAPHVGPGVAGAEGGSLSFGVGNRVYAASQGRVLRSEDRGATWAQIGTASDHRQLVAHPLDPDTVWSHNGIALRRSVDGGATFSPVTTGLTTNASYTQAITGTPIGVAISHLSRTPDFPSPTGSLWIASEGGGLFRSSDGLNWSTANEGLSGVNIRALAVNPNPATASASQGLSIYAGFGDVFYSSPALYRTTGGAALGWQARNTLLRASQIRSVAIDPTTARPGDSVTTATVYAAGDGAQAPGFRNTGIYKSTNSGASWSTLQGGLPLTTASGATFANLRTVRSIVLDPRSCTAEPRPPLLPCAELPPGAGTSPLQRVYAAATGIPASGPGGTTVFTHRLVASSDAGATWAALDGNPGFPSSWSGTVEHQGVSYFISRNLLAIPVVVSPSNPDLIYVGISPNFFCSGPGNTECSSSLSAAISDPPTGVVRSTDRGATWTVLSTGLPRLPGFTNSVPAALSLLMHPTNSDVLWVSMTDLGAPSINDRPSPLFKTTDGGATWFDSSNGIPPGTDIRALAVDPDDGNLVYAAGAGTLANPGSVYRSTDGGATWRSMSIGLPAGSALALAVDPHNATVLHAGTNSGVWSIEQVPDTDGDGIPDAIETFAPNGGDGNGDGTSDSIQGQVGSTIIILNAQTFGEAVAEAKSGGGGYITTEVVSGTGACAQAVDVQNRIAARYGRDYLPDQQRFYRYPRDLVQFEVLDCSSVVVDVIYHNANFANQHGWTMRFRGPAEPGMDETIGWHDISSRAQRIGPNRWRLTLKANEFGSYRPVQDRILFLGGPACYDDRVFYNGGFEAAPTAPATCS
jgi:photosystem II stability/assembly factor-like uncharacterized protein